MTDLARRPALDRTAAALAAPRPQAGAREPGLIVGEYGGPLSGYVRRLMNGLNALSPTTGLTFDKIAKMRRHYQVAACLLVNAQPLLRADWTIECEDDDVREGLTAAYSRIAFQTHRAVSRAMPYGFAPNELVWDLDTLVGWHVSEVRDLEPRSCVPLVDDAGTFAGFEQRHANGRPVTIEPDYALWVVEGMESGNLYGRSVLEAALDPWQDAAAIRAFRLRALERFGEPVVKTRAPEGRTMVNEAEVISAAAEQPPRVVDPRFVENLDVALEMGENLRHHSVLALPSTLLFGPDAKPAGFAWDVEYLEASTSSDDGFRSALQDTDKAIARAIFVPDLLFGDGNGVGSYALGDSHRDVWTAAVEGRLDDYSRQITDQLLTPMRTLNYGERAPSARLVFAPLADELRDQLWTIADGMISRGAITPAGEEIASRLGIPVQPPEEKADAAANPFASVGLPALVQAGIITPDEARELLGLDGAAPIPDAAPAPVPVGEEQLRRAQADPHACAALRQRLGLGRTLPPSNDPETLAAAAPIARLAAAGNVDGLPAWKLPQSFDPPPFVRPMNAREQRVGFLALERGMNGAEDRTIATLVELLEVERARVGRQLDAILRKGSRAEVIAALGTIELKGRPGVAKAWADLMTEVWGVALEQLAGEVSTYAESLPTTIGPEGRALVKAYAAANADRVLASVASTVQLELLNAYTSSVSPAGMAAVVADVFEKLEAGEGGPVRLTTRMLSSKAVNVARRDGIERGGVPLRGAQYSALLDRRTCELCVELDEQIIAVTHTDLERFTPPVHHNCRCVWVWITEEELDFAPTWSTPSTTKVGRFGGLVIG